MQFELLKSLSEIFGSDGDFSRIEIKHHDKEENESLWEVFLREERKGLIPLSKSGSGLKTVVLMLLNLLVIPAIKNKPKSSFVFALEELENNLHPALLRRLFSFLAAYVEREQCSLFLTTHSNIALDFFGLRTDSQIIQVIHDGESASKHPAMPF